MFIGFLGVAISRLFVVLTVIPIPGIVGVLPKESYIVLIAWIASGVSFFIPSESR